MNVNCAYPGCTNPIIGQCGGYKGSCGRYYCVSHSTGNLCKECAERKRADDNAVQWHQESLQAIADLRKSSASWALTKEVLLIGLASIIFYVGGLLMQNAYDLGHPWTQIGLFLTMAGIIIFIIALIVYWIRFSRRSTLLAESIDKVKPGFLEFYRAWQAERRKQTIKFVGTIVFFVFILLLAAAGSSDEKDKDRDT